MTASPRAPCPLLLLRHHPDQSSRRRSGTAMGTSHPWPADSTFTSSIATRPATAQRIAFEATQTSARCGTKGRADWHALSKGDLGDVGGVAHDMFHCSCLPCRALRRKTDADQKMRVVPLHKSTMCAHRTIDGFAALRIFHPTTTNIEIVSTTTPCIALID
jgi:hypothetical protein